MDFGGGDEIRFERRGKAAVVTLTRPKALNAVTHRMVLALSRALAEWESDDSVEIVVIRGEGRAFSAGGDIVDIYKAGMAGNPPVGFFRDEYRLNAAIARFPKPYIALIDGIVMGGGVGVSFHGSHRVVTENAVFAMPEVGIGFFPDVGASHILPGLSQGFGMYLALTGARIRWGDQLWSGLATHAVEAADLEAVIEALAETGNPKTALRPHCKNPPRDLDDAALHLISLHFTMDTLDAVLAGLRKAAEEGDEFAGKTLSTMMSRSPTSLHVAFQQICAGAMLEMDDCMKMEFRILNRMLKGHDFYEGIRATIIEKGSKPHWRPDSLDKVEPEAIDAYFAPLPDGELEP